MMHTTLLVAFSIQVAFLPETANHSRCLLLFLTGINDSSQIVGQSEGVFGSGSGGFLDEGGNLTAVTDPAAQGTIYPSTFPSGINNAGQIVGYSKFGEGHVTKFHVFVDTGGTFETVNGPSGAFNFFPTGINDADQIVGTYSDINGYSAFLDTGGIFTPIINPAAISIIPTGINNAGQIVGNYDDINAVQHGFVDTGGVFTTINNPASEAGIPDNISVNGINNLGQIVGYYINTTGTHGFIATPVAVPETSPLRLLGIGLLPLGGLLLCIRRRNKIPG